MNNIFAFIYHSFFIYLLTIYIWSKLKKTSVNETEKRLWSFLAKWIDENIHGTPPNSPKIIPQHYAEMIHDSIKNYTNNNFAMTDWSNILYSDFYVPCLIMEIVPKNNNIDADLPIIEVQALDRFNKCTLADNLLASRIISSKSGGKVYLLILYASNDNELNAYNQLLMREKQFADDIGLQMSSPIIDTDLTDIINLFDDTTCGNSHG